MALQTPDITKAQVVALVTAALGTVTSFGVHVSDAQSAALLALTGVVSGLLFTSDAVIRRGRAKVVEAQVHASTYANDFSDAAVDVPTVADGDDNKVPKVAE